MTIFIVSTAWYSEDGDLETSAFAFTTLEAAKESLKEHYTTQKTPTPEFTEEDDEYIEPDDSAWIAKDGMSWGSSGPNQAYGKITTEELK